MKTLQHFNEFVKEITASNSRLHKQSVLQKYKDDAYVKFYLNFAFNPYITTGISTKKLNKIVGDNDIKHLNSIIELLTYLSQHNTGTDQIVSVCQEILNNVCTYDREAGALLEALICKDLSIGCDAKTINKEIPYLIPTFSVQLANKYFDKPQYVEGKSFAITTKIDGGRIIALKENGQVSFYTRAGQKYEGLVDLEDEMSRLMPDNICLDGEITLLVRGNLSSKEAYKETMKIVRTKDKEKHGIKMLVFDAMSVSDFKAQTSSMTYIQRRQMLDCMSAFDTARYFELLPILYHGTDTSKITEILEEEVASGEEGIMINICDAPYSFSRTNDLLKVKKFNSLDLEVVGIEEGSGRLTGTLGTILVRYKDGNIVKVGSGFSDKERKLYWENPDLIMNQVVEVKYFEETTNADKTFSLRFPTWCSNIRTDKLTPDY